MTRNNRKVLLKFFLTTTLLALVPFGVARWQEKRRRNAPKIPYTFPISELAALDKLVQARFAVVPERDFGMSRIGERHEVFVAQTAEEKSVVAALKRRGIEVVFYVAGRNFLKEWETLYLGAQFMQGPVFITGKPPVKSPTPYDYAAPLPHPTITPPPGLPDGGSVFDSSLKVSAQRALEALETSDGVNFSVAKWKMVARPVLA